MPAILTLTFSPCIDKSTAVTELIAAKKLKCSQPRLEPGGGGINVARAIKKLGGEATAVYPAGSYSGKAFNALLQQEEIPAIVIESRNETRENFIVFEEKTGNQYRFNMPGTPLLETEWKECLRVIEETEDTQFIVASGSLPPGVPTDIYAHLALIAKRKKTKLVIDTSGEALKEAVDEGVYLLKPNLGELSALVNSPAYLKEEHKIIEAAKQVIKKGNCEILVVSMGENGAILFSKDVIKKVTPPAVEIKSTVGAGDSMVAGIIYALSQGKDAGTALQFGVASGTAATLHPGTELCSKQETERLFKLIQQADTAAKK